MPSIHRSPKKNLLFDMTCTNKNNEKKRESENSSVSYIYIYIYILGMANNKVKVLNVRSIIEYIYI